MTINKTSGQPLSFEDDIEAEFGNNPLRSLGSYRNTHPDFNNESMVPFGGTLNDLPLDTGIPKSGEIKFSDFYGKKLNIVVDMHSSGNTNYNLDVYANRFANGNYRIVGNYKTSITKNGWRGGKKVVIHINKTFGSATASSTSHVAVKTGNTNNNVNQAGWPSDTIFAIDLGSSGIVAGRGGNGGSTGNEESPGQNGGVGSSAMKLISGMQNVISIASGGAILAGGGGGGSGSGSEQNDSFAWFSDYNSASGGGGGGGAGVPAGSGGTTGGVASAQPGGAGSQTSGGGGGNGGDNEEAEGGNGGAGGGNGASGGNASGGKNLAGSHGSGGSGGSQYLFY
tara:strand:- start:3424 stop:4440 length:1017 start_codon:yes stop_codon:yes gene_type:complete